MRFNIIIIIVPIKNSNWIYALLAIVVGNFFLCEHFGADDEYVMVLFFILCSAWVIVKELEKLNDTWSSEKSDEFAKNFGDWLKYESVCFPEHKDKSIEELLEIYKKSI